MRVRGSVIFTRRPLVVVVTLVTLFGAVAAVAGVLPRLSSGVARADDVTASLNNLRTGWDPDEPGLSPATVGSSDFGQLFESHLNGQIYAQPLVVGQMLIVATEANNVYGLNSVSGEVEWSDYLGKAEPASETDCSNLTPDIGVTSAPVYDPATGNVYLAAVVDNGPSPARPHVYVYALDAQTGAIRPHWPVAIQGSPVNEPGASFNPLSERQRPGLLLLNGWLYAAFGSYCDFLPYAGYVAGVNTSTRALTLWTDEAGLTDNQAGIWQGGGGLMSDGAGRIFISTGNGVSPPVGPGDAPPPELGDAVVRLNVAGNGALSADDFFSPANSPTLDADDEDFGSGGPVGLPFGTASYPDLLVQAGKDGRVFLLNRNDLGGREQGPGGSDDAVSQTGPFGGQWGHPAAFGPDPTVTAATSGDYVYYVGNNDVLRYLQFGVNSAGVPVLTDVASSSTTFGFSSGSPVVTSDGDDAASAVVWEIYAAGEGGGNGSLQAFAADPGPSCSASTPCTMSPIWSAPIGTAGQFSIPATSGGRVYVGTRDGNLFAFGGPDMAPLTAAPVNFGGALVHGVAKRLTVTVTAASAVRVSAISVAQPARGAPFKAGAPSVDGTVVRLPVTLAAGDRLTVPVSFAPSVPAGVTAALRLITTAANFPTVDVSLTGRGVVHGLYAVHVIGFGKVAGKTTVTKTVIVSNGNTRPERIMAVGKPASPFSATLPARGRVLAPGQSIAIAVRYRPTRAAAATSSLSISASFARRLVIRLTGTGKKDVSAVVAARAAIRFGSVRLGSSATKTIVIRNAGDLPATITSASGPGEPFGTQVLAPAGTPVSPGYTLSIPISFAPTSAGNVLSSYVLRWSDATGQHRVAVAVSGTGVSPARGTKAVPPPGGGWTLNGSATLSGQQQLSLTSGRRYRAGSAVYGVPQPSNGLTASFTADLSGAGGMAMALLNAAKTSTAGLGHPGSQFGFGGLPGVAVTLGTHRYRGDPSGNFVGVAVGAARKSLHYLATTSRVPTLTKRPRAIVVSVLGRRVVVYVDGKRVLSVLLRKGTIPGKALVAFTGGTAKTAGAQAVTGVAIRARGRHLPAPGGGWSYNGSASMRGSVTGLTAAGTNESGSVVYPVAVPVAGLRVSFTAQIYGGSGADGLTFSLLNPADGATSVGGDGAGYGVAGLAGVTVVLSTDVDVNGLSQSVFVADASSSSSALSIVQLADLLPPLRIEPDQVTVQVEPDGSSDVITVTVDGEQVLQQFVPALTTTALLAFTGATGAITDVHLVRNVAISTGG